MRIVLTLVVLLLAKILLARIKDREHKVNIRATTEFLVVGNKAQTLPKIGLQDRLQIIGLWDAQNQEISATRLFLANISTPEPSSPKQNLATKLHQHSSIKAQLTTTYLGVASWFCCSPAYGPCPSYGGGSCGGCQSSQYHCAWPRRSDNPYCNFVGCGENPEGVVCNQDIFVHNSCTNRGVYVKVQDCGPNEPQFCNERAGDCHGYYNRIVDLTPAAFSVLANLSAGLCSVECS